MAGEQASFPAQVEAVVFDLDGTLVETELLKARAYAKVAQNLHRCTAQDRLGLLVPTTPSAKVLQHVTSERPQLLMGKTPEEKGEDTAGQVCADVAMQVFLTNLGATSEAVARKLVQELGIADLLKPEMERFGVDEPWKALYKLRKEIYYDQFATPENLNDSRYPAAINLLHTASVHGLPCAVATSSSTADAERVLEALGIQQLVQHVVGRDQVQKAKPNPESYLTAAKRLGVNISKCLVFEDSVTGLTAGVTAGANVVAIASPFTAESLRRQAVLPQSHIAYSSDQIWPVIKRMK